MTLPAYNQALLEMARQSLAELERTAAQKTGKRTPAQESHFLCTWMADSLKEKRFSRLVMEDLKAWVQLGRTLGRGPISRGCLSGCSASMSVPCMSRYSWGRAWPICFWRWRGGLAGVHRQRTEHPAAAAEPGGNPA